MKELEKMEIISRNALSTVRASEIGLTARTKRELWQWMVVSCLMIMIPNKTI